MTRSIRHILAALLLVLLPVGAASAQGNNDFMAGRLFQIARETAPSFTAEAPPTFGTLETGQSRSFEHPVAMGTCYTWIAVGDSGQADLDLSVRLDGVLMAADDAPDDWPIVQYCAPTDGAARIDLVMYAGSGGFAFNTYQRFFGGADALELQMNYLASLFAVDHVPAGEITRATLTQGGEETFPLQLNGGRCYTIIGTAGPGVGDIDFFLTETASGQLVQSDVAPDAAPVVGLCPPASGNYALRVVMYQGGGELAWQPFVITF
jgi:hypothetical protein